MANVKKVDLKSKDFTEEFKEELKKKFPQVFNEDKVDCEKLKLALGEGIDTGRERYGMNWPGKAKAIRVAQEPSMATLKPDRDSSVDFDNTENLFLEGDNLEILKLLQRSYFGKIKMIYIDPPYNTGKEFIYPDKYAEGLETYLQYTGQIDAEGKKFTTNVDTDGRYHSKWMNMMYSRLLLARNLLTKDGIIFISIDDHEADNLKKICNEVFGEENFITNFLWKKKSTTSNVEGAEVSSLLDSTLCYKRTDHSKIKQRVREKSTRNYPLSNEEGNYRFAIIEKKDSGSYKRDTMKYKILGHRPRKGKRWQIGEATARELEIKNRFIYDGEKIKLKIYDFEDKDTFSAQPNLLDFCGTTESAARFVNNDLFNVPELFDNPKPVELIEHLINIVADEKDIVLDFFAGSATTAHAVMKLNTEKKLERKFIVTQLPEPVNKNSEAEKVGYKNICEIGKERIRKAAKLLNDKSEKNNIDYGFKVYKLDRSNFSIWDGKDGENVQQKLLNHIDHIAPGSTDEDILYELLLKSGYELASKVEEKIINTKKVYSVAGGELVVCLEKEIDKELVKAIAELKPKKVICLNIGFKTDADLTNAAQILKTKEIEFRTV